jgi:hypothetical protein
MSILPAAYRDYIAQHGTKGFVGDGAYLMLWKPEELAAMNEGYKVEEFAPGLFLFGSNGGGEAFGFDTRTPDWHIVRIPFIPMSWDDVIPMGETFEQFIENMRNWR